MGALTESLKGRGGGGARLVHLHWYIHPCLYVRNFFSPRSH